MPPWRARPAVRASGWVVVLMWVLPALGFAVAARLSADTGAVCDLSATAPACGGRAQVVLLGALSGVLLVPAGLLALLITQTLVRTTRAPSAFKPALAASLVTLAVTALFLTAANLLA